MKAYWFAFKPSDWLSSPDVRMMSKAERGTYINLLCLAWESTPTGHLPAEEDMVRRLAEMSVAEWQESGAILLKKFPLAPCGTYRINPRQAEEVVKQQAKSEVNAEAGRRSAAKRAAQREANEKPTDVAQNQTGVENTATNGQRKGNKTQTQTQSSYEDVKASPSDKAKVVAQALTDPADEQHWSVGPLTKSKPFQVICERLGFEGIDFEFYRKQALVAAEDGNVSRTIAQWNSWVRNFFNNQMKNGPLIKFSATMPTEPTPRQEYPQPGKERKGQVIAIDCRPCDDVMTRQKVASFQKHWPTAIIHPIRNRPF